MSDNKCNHILYKNCKKNSTFCTSCGCLIITDKHTNKIINSIKSKDYFFKLEFNPIDMLNDKEFKFVNRHKYKMNSELSDYNLIRPKIVNKIKHFVKEFNCSDEIFFFSLFYTDSVLRYYSKNKEIIEFKLELIALGFLLIASKLYFKFS